MLRRNLACGDRPPHMWVSGDAKFGRPVIVTLVRKVEINVYLEAVHSI